MNSIPPYDLLHIETEAMNMIENGGKIESLWYFGAYTNNIPITIFIYFVYKIGILLKVENLKSMGIILNSLCMTITALFTYLSVKKISDNYKSGIITLIFFVLNPIFYLYASYFYTDTLCMPFAMISIYLFIIAIKDKKRNISYINLILSSFILAVGFKIRVVIVIMLIAYIIWIIIHNYKIKEKMFKLSCLVIGFLLGIMLYKCIFFQFDIQLDKSKEIPVTHWIMMGLNEKNGGKYLGSDLNNTKSQKSYEDKIQYNMLQINERLKEKGISEYISFLIEKIGITWSNGDYDILAKLENVEHIDGIYEYIVGNKKVFLMYYLQICKIVTIFLFICAIIDQIRRKKDTMYLFYAILGAVIFYMLWEAGTRYSLSFLPWMFITLYMGLQLISKIIDTSKIKVQLKNNSYKEVNIYKIKKYIAVFIFATTLLLIVINFDKYAIKKNIYRDKRVMQTTSYSLLEIENNVIEQKFKVDKKFNCIEIKMSKRYVKNKTNYVLELYNTKNKLLYTKSLSSNEIVEGYNVFMFNDIKPKNTEEYTIKISSNDAKKGDSIALDYCYKKNFSTYPEGECMINGSDKKSSLTFKVEREFERTYVTKKVYIFISMCIIILEIFVFRNIIYKKQF